MKNLFKPYDQEIDLSTPHNTSAEFRLMYGKIDIGILELREGVWTFAYSNEFILQDEINTIVSFPDKYKVYQSSKLFPFFAFRIPSLQRLKIQKKVMDDIVTDEVTLLKMFGKQSISNPFQLIASS
jgi:HipA-like protein